jgi:hypothetical protein
MVADPDRVEPDVLGGPSHRDVLRPPHVALDLGELDPDAERSRHGGGSLGILAGCAREREGTTLDARAANVNGGSGRVASAAALGKEARRMDETTTPSLTDEDMTTSMPGSASVEERPDGDDTDDTDTQDADGTDGDAEDMKDGDAKDMQDGDAKDMQDADGVDQPA